MAPSSITVGLVQIGDLLWERRPTRSFHLVDGALRLKPQRANQAAASLAYFPHTAALLQGYLAAHPPEGPPVRFLRPLYKRLPIADAAAHLARANIVGLSVYVWNIRYSLALARAVKDRNPDALVVLGGPQVPDRAEAFLREHPSVDLVCHGEGERTFADVVARWATRAWDGVASTSFLDGDGRFVANARRARMRDLDAVPSPMLTGIYDDLIAATPEQQWLATWETNRGCPFTCAFCDWGSATGSKVTRYGDERLFAEIDWLADRGIQHVFVCDANFGMLPRDVEIARRLGAAYSAREVPLAISVQSTKNRVDRSEEIQRVFRESRAVSFGASISLQSVDPSVLKAIRRDNISLEAFDRLQAHYAAEGLDTYTDLIVGLPGETYDSFADGLASVILNGQLNRIAFYECFVLPNAPMAQPDYREAFAIETVAVRIAHAHEPLERPDGGEPELIDMVVATASMARSDWVRARTLAYFVELLMFDRLLHVPLVLLGVGRGVGLRRMFEAFLDVDASTFPVVGRLRDGLLAHAGGQLLGGPQYVAAPDDLGLWWPADQHALIELARDGNLEGFYAEAAAILAEAADDDGVDPLLVADAVRLNQAMFALPFQLADETVTTAYPVGHEYLALIAGERAERGARPSSYHVAHGGTVWMSWEDWCEDLIRRAYLRKGFLSPIAASAHEVAL